MMRKMFLFLLAILFVGCSYFVSWDETVKGGVGRPIDSIIKLDGSPDEIRVLPDGQSEYKYKLDRSCTHYWIVNKEGIITGYRYTGYCRPIG